MQKSIYNLPGNLRNLRGRFTGKSPKLPGQVCKGRLKNHRTTYVNFLLRLWIFFCMSSTYSSTIKVCLKPYSWWRHQIETFSASLAFCAGNSPVTGEFPTQRPVTRSFDVFFDLRLNKRLSKQSWGWWFETPSRSLWRHRNVKWQLLFPVTDNSISNTSI